MEAIDAFFGQNWVDQAQREHPIHPNTMHGGLSCEEVLRRELWESITWLMTWSNTEQGYRVWLRRHEMFDCQPILDSIR